MKDVKIKRFGDDLDTDRRLNAFLEENNIEYVDLKYLGENGVLLVYREKENKESVEENQKYKEIIDKLKDIVKNRHTNGKVYWFDAEYAKTYGELCDMAGAGETRTPVVLLSEIEDILKGVENE